MKINTEKILKTTIKLATFLYTSPATLSVAGKIYQDNQIANLIVKLSGWILLEGLMLIGWSLLDSDKKASPMLRGFYALLAVVAYSGTLVVAIANGEGLVGWVFRLSALLAILFSVVQSGLINIQRKQKREDRDISKNVQVRLHARRLGRKEAKLQREMLHKQRIAQMNSDNAVFERQLKLTTEKKLQNLSGHTAISPMPNVLDNGRKKAQRNRQKSKETAQRHLVGILAGNGSLPVSEMADRIGKSYRTTARYLKELTDNGTLTKSANGYRVNGKEVQMK